MKCCSSCKKVNSITTHHFCTEFCVWLEKTPKDTIVLFKKAFGDKHLNNSSIKKWRKEFKDGWKLVHDAPRSTPLLFHRWRRSTFVHQNISEPLEHVQNLSELNTNEGTQNEMYVFCVGSSCAHKRTIRLCLPLAEENLKKLQDLN